MTALMLIEQVGLPGGTAGKSRSDGLLTGAVVTVTSTVPGETNALELLWIPDGDTGTPASFMSIGGAAWQFTPSPNCPGTYRILLTVDGVDQEVRELRVRTALLRQIVPSLNELANPNANLTNNGAALVLASEDNENELALLPGLYGAEPSAVPSPFIAGNYGGWYPWVRDTSIQMEDRAAALDPQGFQRPDSLQDTAAVDSAVAWDTPTGNFTVNPFDATFYDIFIQGRRVRKESQQLVTLNAQGENWVYFDTAQNDLLAVTANPTVQQRADIMRSKTPVAVVVFETGEGNEDPVLIVDKRHGLGISPAAKASIQVGAGARWVEGLLPSGFSLDDGSEDEDAQFEIGDGFALMGDLLYAVADATPTAEPQALEPVVAITRWLHRLPGGIWGRLAGNATFPTNAGGSAPVYDTGSGTTAIPNGQFVLATYFAVKSMPGTLGGPSNHEGDRIIAIVGQALLATEEAAQAAAETVLVDLDTAGLPIQDMVPICTVIIQKDTGFANAAAARIIPTASGGAFIDHRSVAHEAASTGGGGGGGGGGSLNAAYLVGNLINMATASGDLVIDATNAVAFELRKSASNVFAMDSAGALTLSAASGQDTTIDIVGSGEFLLQDDGSDVFALNSGGDMSITPIFDSRFEVIVDGGGALELSSQGDGEIMLIGAGMGDIILQQTGGANVRLEANDVTLTASLDILGTADNEIIFESSTGVARLSSLSEETQLGAEDLVTNILGDLAFGASVSGSPRTYFGPGGMTLGGDSPTGYDDGPENNFLGGIFLDAVNTEGPNLESYDLSEPGTDAGAYSIGVDTSLIPNVTRTDLQGALEELGGGPVVTAVIVGTNQNLAIGGTGPWDASTFFRVTSVANSVIAGLLTTGTGGARIRHIVNGNAVGGGITVSLLDESGGGAATSDIIIEGGDLVLQPGGVATVWEDPVTNRWRVM